uniref:AlNc14C292G10258 protein n=1 Tax=Albugo laibachii Nc14 TaxID=890382 RepID=F0WVB3_9STRA|nr:AlNc14C292G10258 [Albugo laibachii Nc14]|eukprot:CCA25352.1 AlNc14C292G10258 [Albugo laibachii Nc14]
MEATKATVQTTTATVENYYGHILLNCGRRSLDCGLSGSLLPLKLAYFFNCPLH